MFEHRSEPLVSGQRFALRLLGAFAFSILIVLVSLAIGVLGYGTLGEKTWDAAFHKTCLVLSGHEVAVDESHARERVFAGLFVLYARLIFVGLVGILVMPVAHRILHQLHLDDDDIPS